MLCFSSATLPSYKLRYGSKDLIWSLHSGSCRYVCKLALLTKCSVLCVHFYEMLVLLKEKLSQAGKQHQISQVFYSKQHHKDKGHKKKRVMEKSSIHYQLMQVSTIYESQLHSPSSEIDPDENKLQRDLLLPSKPMVITAVTTLLWSNNLLFIFKRVQYLLPW